MMMITFLKNAVAFDFFLKNDGHEILCQMRTGYLSKHFDRHKKLYRIKLQKRSEEDFMGLIKMI